MAKSICWQAVCHAPPFSVAGKQLGEEDERDLFPQMLRLIEEIQPRIAMIENVRGLLDTKFDAYRAWITGALEKLGYTHHTQLLNASDYGVPQLRPRVVIIAVSAEPVTAVPSVRDAKKSKVRHNPTASHLRGSIWHRCGSLWRSSGSNKPANKSELDVE